MRAAGAQGDDKLAQLIDRLGRADEVAKLACFLASDEAAYITGAAFPVDGGALAWHGVRA